MPTQKRPKSAITRSGTRRLGDDFQDLLALEVCIDWLEHAERYEWVEVEADNAKALDDVVARKRNGTTVYRQSKFAVHPDDQNNLWTWETLLKQDMGAKGPLSSLLQDWARSLQHILASGEPVDAALHSNREAAYEIRQAFRQDDATLIDFAMLPPAIQETITIQLGSTEMAQHFFQHFHFLFNRPHLEDLEGILWRKFSQIGGTREGWLSLKNELRSWVCHRYEPPPDGRIRLADIQRAALWYELKGLTQEYAIPDDYVPPKAFLHMFEQLVLDKSTNCIVLAGSPGVGKSTFISYLYARFLKKKIPVVRHHYYLNTDESASGLRLGHLQAAESLMHDLARDHANALGSLLNRNPRPQDLPAWLTACGQYYAQQGKALIILIDGLDHVWREHKSLDELIRLLEYLLPPSKGIVIVCATQPVDESRLPPLLLRQAPPEQWQHLPLLDLPAIEQWLHKHIRDFPLQTRQMQSAAFTARLADALYEKGHGHPLHLRYTLRAIQERNLAFTEQTIAALPGCPHKGIIGYYEELWRELPEGSREIMHLLAATQFPWPKQGITTCLDPRHQNIARIREDLRQVSHLLIHDTLGLRPFHSSIFTFVTQLSDHQIYATPHLQKTRDWLQRAAPAAWQWAYSWKIEAMLGNEEALYRGPSRQWAREALVQRRPSKDMRELLHLSMESALRHADLPRLIELGLLHDYSGRACEDYRDIREQLFYIQLELEDDPDLCAWVFNALGDLTDGELVLLAEYAQDREDLQAFERCKDLLRERWRNGRQLLAAGSYPTWQQSWTPLIALLAMSRTTHNVTGTLKWASHYRTKSQAQEMLSLYSVHLRAWQKIDQLRMLFALPVEDQQTPQSSSTKETTITREEAFLFRRHTTLLALEEGLELDEGLLLQARNDPFVALYAIIQGIAQYQPAIFPFPDTHLLHLQWYQIYDRQFDLRELFYQAFFCFLVNSLFRGGERNGTWLNTLGPQTWPIRFLQELNTCAAIAAAGIKASRPMTFGAFFASLNRNSPSSFHEHNRFEEDTRTAIEYYKAACHAAIEIGLDLVTLAGAQGSNSVLTQQDLQQAWSSSYCEADAFLKCIATRRRHILDDTAIQWVINNQTTFLQTTILPCTERAQRWALLGTLAILHRKRDVAHRCVEASADHLLGHGYHKDILFYNTLDAIQRYAKSLPKDERETIIWPWLKQLAPAIAAIRDYTDGDETRDLPVDLAHTLALVAPEKLPAYYHWQCNCGEHWQAMSTLHVFLEQSDLSDPIAQSLAVSAIDSRSLNIIADRAAQGHPGAQIVLARQQLYLGSEAFARRDEPAPQQKIVDQDKKAEFDPVAYPPEAFDTFLQHGAGALNTWVEYWIAHGKKKEIYEVLVNAEQRGIDISECYHHLFALTRTFYGKEKAYPWLIKAHILGNGWNWYISRQNEVEQRWRTIKQIYPNKWLDFLTQTVLQTPVWRSSSFSHMEFRYLLEFCLYMGQIELARSLVDQMVQRSLELVSMLPLPLPEWINMP
jgi:hypothetical protein